MEPTTHYCDASSKLPTKPLEVCIFLPRILPYFYGFSSLFFFLNFVAYSISLDRMRRHLRSFFAVTNVLFALQDVRALELTLTATWLFPLEDGFTINYVDTILLQ